MASLKPVPFPFGDCNICNDKATGVHYGVTTCEGCKGFFKRSITRCNKYRCFFGGNCVLSPGNRNRCKSCRFQRCLSMGMSVEAVKMGRIRKVDKERALEEHRRNSAVGAGVEEHRQNGAVGAGVEEQPALSTHLTTEFNQTVPSDSRLQVQRQAWSEGIVGVRPEITYSQPAIPQTVSFTPTDFPMATSQPDFPSIPTVSLDGQPQFSGRTMYQENGHHQAEPYSYKYGAGPPTDLQAGGGVVCTRHPGDLSHPPGKGQSDGTGTEMVTKLQVIRYENMAGSAGGDLRDVYGPHYGPDTAGGRNIPPISRTHFSSQVIHELINQVIEKDRDQALPPTLLTRIVDLAKDGLGRAAGPPPPAGPGWIEPVRSWNNDIGGERGREGGSTGLTLQISSMQNDSSNIIEGTLLRLQPLKERLESTYADDVIKMRDEIEGRLEPHSLNQLKKATLAQAKTVWKYLFDVIPTVNEFIIAFCKDVPGFVKLDGAVQGTLIKDAYFSVWLLQRIPLFCKGDSYMRMADGVRYSRWWMNHFLPARLVEALFHFVERIQECNLSLLEIVILCCLCLTDTERSCLSTSPAQILHNHYVDVLAHEVQRNHGYSQGQVLLKIFKTLSLLEEIHTLQRQSVGTFSANVLPDQCFELLREESCMDEEGSRPENVI